MTDKNKDSDATAVAVAAGVGIAALAGLFGLAIHTESRLTPAERAAREQARREAEQARALREASRREAEEEQRRKLAAATVKPLIRREPFDGLLEALLTGQSSSMSQTVALYHGHRLAGPPAKVLQLTVPTQVGDLLLTPTPEGVTVQYFGTFGPKKERVKSGEHEYLIGQYVTIAVL